MLNRPFGLIGYKRCSDGRKAPTVERGWPQSRECRHMRRGTIAFVRSPAIAGVIGVGSDHDPVAIFFGDDARGGDAGVEAVAADDRGRAVTP